MNWPVKLDVEDLKHVSEILAPINPPATEPLDAEKKSRFLSDNQIEENWFVFVIQARSIDFESGGPDSSKKILTSKNKKQKNITHTFPKSKT